MTTILYTDKGNCHTLKILAAVFEYELDDFELRIVTAGEHKPTEAQYCPWKDQLPVLVVKETTIFSANAACRYIFHLSSGEANVDGVAVDELSEWECTVLWPAVYVAVATGNKASLDALKTVVEVMEKKMQHQQPYVLGTKLSSADLILFASMYPVMCEDSKLSDVLGNSPEIKRWFGELKRKASVQKAISILFADYPTDDIRTSLLSSPAPRLAAAAASKPHPVASPTPSSEMDSSSVELVSAEEIAAATEAWRNGLEKASVERIRTHPVLPLSGEKNVLITSALPYVNNVPHLGNVIGCVLSADVFSRYCRLRGHNSLYICGTDEYGTATETKAIEEGLTPRQICDKYHQLHADIYQWFHIDFDAFGRTSTPKHTEIAHHIFWKLYNNSYISKDSVQQLRCETCQRFLADRFVEGVCPLCAFEDARGDQCDGCGKLINATELLKPRCKVCGGTPVVRTSEHLFLDLPKIEPLLTTYQDSTFATGHWTNNAKVITKSWIRDGLKPRCISRDLKWGVDVPLDGYTDKVFYVWFDACFGYISITANYTDEWQKWWKNPDQVELYQFMAKDNVPFHGVVFPSSLLGTHESWTTINHLSATEYLNYEDGKFSKSRGKGVFGNDTQETGIPADIWRFYLLYVRPESQDSVFSWDDFAMKNNSELLNNLGNFINRALMFVNNNFAGEIQQMALIDDDYRLLALVTKELRGYLDNLEHIRIRDGIRNVLAISRLGNQYMQVNKPWVLVKGCDTDRQRAGTVLGLAANIVCLLSAMLHPYMPKVSETIQTQLAAPPGCNVLNDSFVCRLPAGHKIGKASPLFQKIEASVIADLKKRFAGKQAETSSAASPEIIQKLTDDITKQGDVVRQLKASKADKKLITEEVSKLLELKKQLNQAQTGGGMKATNAVQKKAPISSEDSNKLRDDIEKQGNIVRQLKADKAQKEKIDAEVAKLLDLKKRLTLNDTPPELGVKSKSPELIAKLTSQVKDQGDVVRKLKADKADKPDIDAAVVKLLDLKKQLAAAGGTDATAVSKKKGGKKK